MSIGKVSNGFCIGRGYRLARVPRDLILAGGVTNQSRRLTQPWAQAFLHQTACVSITGWHICSMTVHLQMPGRSKAAQTGGKGNPGVRHVLAGSGAHIRCPGRSHRQRAGFPLHQVRAGGVSQ